MFTYTVHVCSLFTFYVVKYIFVILWKKIEIDLLIWKGAWLKIWWWPLICDYKVDWILFKQDFYALTTNMLPSLAPKFVSLSTLNEQGIKLYIGIFKFLLPCELAYLGILMNQSSRLVSHLGPVKIVGASMSWTHF